MWIFAEGDPAIKEQYFAQFEEQFFMFCDKELEKVNTFFAGLSFDFLYKSKPLVDRYWGGGEITPFPYDLPAVCVCYSNLRLNLKNCQSIHTYNFVLNFIHI